MFMSTFYLCYLLKVLEKMRRRHRWEAGSLLVLRKRPLWSLSYSKGRETMPSGTLRLEVKNKYKGNWNLIKLIFEALKWNWVGLLRPSSRKQGLGCQAYIRPQPWCHCLYLNCFNGKCSLGSSIWKLILHGIVWILFSSLSSCHQLHSLKVDFSLDKGTKKVNILFVNWYLVTSGKLEMVEFFKA